MIDSVVGILLIGLVAWGACDLADRIFKLGKYEVTDVKK